MQVTVTIPDDFAAQVQAQGLSPESYIEQLVAQKITITATQADTAKKLAQLETFFAEMATHSTSVPLLPDTSFTRESIYQDHD